MERYKLIKQDLQGKLQLGKIYNIEDYTIYNVLGMIKIYRLTRWQLENMFEKVKEK